MGKWTKIFLRSDNFSKISRLVKSPSVVVLFIALVMLSIQTSPDILDKHLVEQA